MSGGYFDYKQNYIKYIKEELDDLDDYQIPEGDNKVLDDINKLKILLNKTYVRVQRLDYLLSGDDSLETYHKRLQGDLYTT